MKNTTKLYYNRYENSASRYYIIFIIREITHYLLLQLTLIRNPLVNDKD